jgi:hypothetical protein
VRWIWVLALCACHTDARPGANAVRDAAWHTWATLDIAHWTPSEQLLYAAPPGPPHLRPLKPFRVGDRLETETLPLVFDVLFSPTAAAHVRDHRLSDASVLRALARFPAFPPDAAIVKLVWYPLPIGGAIELPVWDDDTALPDGNPTRTWSRTVTISEAQLDDFIHDDRDGVHMLLIAAHVTTKALPDWTWATFWWHDRPDAGPFADGRPDAVRGAARHYRMNAAFDAGTPCFNPYLEARFPDGKSSSCLACHRRAVVGATDYLPVTHGRLPDDDPYFRAHVPTDFVWSLALEAQ